MIDITICKGEGCNMKDTCNRYSTKIELLDSYFTRSPYTVKNGKQSCKYKIL